MPLNIYYENLIKHNQQRFTLTFRSLSEAEIFFWRRPLIETKMSR